MARVAQGDCPARQSGNLPVQPSDGAAFRILPRHLQSCRRIFGRAADRNACCDPSELESAIAAQAREANGGIVVMPETFTLAHRAEITTLAARYRLPAIYAYRIFAELGGLSSYGNDLTDNFRRAATYADRILKGAKPSELPVQAPVKFELVINMKTARALGLELPPTLLATADEVIE